MAIIPFPSLVPSMTHGRTTASSPHPPVDEGRWASFEADVVDSLLGQTVLVESARGQRFKGTLEYIHLPTRHVLLRDVSEQPVGASYPEAFVSHVDWIVPTDRDEERA